MAEGSRHYPKEVTKEWLDELVVQAVYETNQRLALLTKDRLTHYALLTESQQEELEEGNIITRAVRGFMAEYLRQARDDSPYLNPSSDMPFTPEQQELLKRESAPGLMHAKACMNQFQDIGLDYKESLAVLEAVIKSSIIRFLNDYQEFTGEPAHSSIKKDVEALQSHFEAREQQLKERKEPASSRYPQAVTNQWVDKVVSKAVRYEMTQAKRDIVWKDKYAFLSKNRDFLRRATRGFIAEFLRQTADDIPDVNDAIHTFPRNKDQASPEERKHAAEELRKARREQKNSWENGLHHAAACVNWLTEHGMDKDEAFKTVGLVVRHAIDVYTDEYLNLDPDQTSQASVKFSKSRVMQYADRKKDSAKDPKSR